MAISLDTEGTVRVLSRLAGRKLTLEAVLAELLGDGLLQATDREEVLVRTGPKEAAERHPLDIIAGHKIKQAKSPYKILTLEELTQWLADKAGLSYLRIDPLKTDMARVTEAVSYAYAARHGILPVEMSPTEVAFATAEPFLSGWMDELTRILHRKIRLVVSNPLDVERFRVEFYGVSRSVKRASEGSKEARFLGTGNFEQLVELGRAGKLDANDRHIVHIVDWLLQYAFDQRASDIHLEPRRDVGNIRFRIDGVLHQVYQVPSQVMAAVTNRVKTLGRMDVAEKRRPQDGRVKTLTPDSKEIEMRLSTMPTAFGEKLVMRIFDPDVLVRSFRDLGFSEEDERRWDAMVSQPNGIILVTGPTGSGKTTTLYSTLKQLARPEVNVCTVEDPIEMVENSFNQMQVQHNIELNFATGIRTLMRQDPDIIMVGEIRDLETAEMAIQASLTGHLVLSTLHTNDAASAVTRLLDLGVPYYLVKATLLGVVAQRLIRTLCPHCKSPAPVDDELWTLLTQPWRLAKPTTTSMQAVGCLECRNTGYLGRVGLYEIMTMTDGLRDLIRDQVDESALRARAIKEGMRVLKISGARKIALGLTTPDEVLKVVPTRID